jgi:hypothetical protein
MTHPSLSHCLPTLTGEFTSLEEPSNDSIIVTVSGFLADGYGFARSERRVEPEGLTKMLRLPIVNFVSRVSSTFVLLLAKSKKAVESIIPTPRVPTVGAN